MADGIYWKNGERWLREGGKEMRIKDLAPNLESQWEMENFDLVKRMREGLNPPNIGSE